jgi:HK97 family phage prohead protease
MPSSFTDMQTTEEKATEYKAMPGQFNIDEALGIVECFVAGIGNKDSVGDVCLPGAFSGSLKRRKPRVVWGHNWNEPIGKVIDIYEVGPNDPRLPMKMKRGGIGGLYARVQFNLKSERGKEAFNSVVFFGEEQEWSIGYKTLDAVFDPSQQANMLKEVELYEVSPVLHGANQLTGTISIKADQQLKDPKGGLTSAGRKYFKETEGANLKPGVKGPADTPEKMRRKGSFLTRFYTNPSGPLVDEDGEPTRLALAATAWGEPVPKNRQDAAELASKGRRMLERYGKQKTKADPAQSGAKCPTATKDVAVNIKNRQKAINTAGYGPLNPKEVNAGFWDKKASRWDVTASEAKKQQCGNCAVFIKTSEMESCIQKGLASGGELGNSAWDVISAADLGYCEAFDFKCASSRTCDAWVVGGPITDASSKNKEVAEKSAIYESPESMSNTSVGRMAELAKALSERFSSPVKIRTADRDMVIFDIVNGGQSTTMRVTYYFDGDEFMFGEPHQVRAETVYLPVNTPAGIMPGHAFPDMEEENEYAHGHREMMEDIEKKPHGSCGCGGTCGTSMPSINWSAFKEQTPGAHLFVRALGNEKSVAMELVKTVCDYHGIELKELEDGVAVPFIDSLSEDGYEAVMNIAQNMSEGFSAKSIGGKLRRIGRMGANSMARFDPDARDADGDRVIQEGTTFQRPDAPKAPQMMPKVKPIQVPRREDVPIKPSVPSIPTPTPTRVPVKPKKAPAYAKKPRLSGAMSSDKPQSMDDILKNMTPAQRKKFQRDMADTPRVGPIDGSGGGTMIAGMTPMEYELTIARNARRRAGLSGAVSIMPKNVTVTAKEREEIQKESEELEKLYNSVREDPASALDAVLDAKDADEAWNLANKITDTTFDDLSLAEAETALYDLKTRWEELRRGINSEWDDSLADRLSWADEEGVIKHLMKWQDMNKREATKEATRLQNLWDVANQAEQTYSQLKEDLKRHIKSLEKEEEDY